jgi:hypothetical protein
VHFRYGWYWKKYPFQKIAERYNLKYFSGGDALKALAIKQGY